MCLKKAKKYKQLNVKTSMDRRAPCFRDDTTSLSTSKETLGEQLFHFYESSVISRFISYYTSTKLIVIIKLSNSFLKRTDEEAKERIYFQHFIRTINYIIHIIQNNNRQTISYNSLYFQVYLAVGKKIKLNSANYIKDYITIFQLSAALNVLETIK